MPELTPRTPWQRVRPSRYGANLRTGDFMDEFPLLDGNNNWTGQNNFNNLWVRNLYVTDNLVVYDSYIDISATSAASLGVTDGYDFRLHSNNVTRIQMLSAGQLVLTSAILDGASINVASISETFPGANAYPLPGWTLPGASAGTDPSAFMLSSNMAMPSAYNGAINAMYHNLAVWSYGDAIAEASLSGSSNNERAGVAVRMSSAGANCYAWGSNSPNACRLDSWFGGIPSSLSLPAVTVPAGFNTFKLIASAGGTGVFLIGYLNGAFVTSAEQASAGTYLSGGFQGLIVQAPAGSSATSVFDNFQILTTSYPLSAQDVVFGSSAALWAAVGQTSLGQWGYVTTDLLQLGYNTNVTISGVGKKFTVAEGTSAILPAATFGVVRLLSAVGTPGLSGTVGLSGVGLTISAVANDILISAAALATSALWAASANLALSALNYAASAIWASAAASATWATSASFAAAAASASAAWIYPGTVTAPGIQFTDAAGSAGMFQSSAGSISFSTNGIERIRITSAGAIGIAKYPPNPGLDIFGNLAASAGDLLLSNARWLQFYDTSLVVRNLFQLDSSNDIIIRNPVGDILLHNNTTGAVGIRHTTPTAGLHLGTTFQMSAVTSANLDAASATRSGMIAVDLTASALIIYVGAARMSAAFAAF